MRRFAGTNEDQWGFMAGIRRLSEEETAGLIPRLSPGNELGVLRTDDEEAGKPWKTARMRWSGSDFPQEVRLVKANMLYIEKAGISQRGLNAIKRVAAFRNPEFYKAQALRLPTYEIVSLPAVIVKTARDTQIMR